MAVSRTGSRFRRARRSRTSCLKSGMLYLGNTVDGRDEIPPGAALGPQNLLSGSGQPVVTAPALASLVHPASFDPAALFEPVQQRIQRSHVEAHGPARTHLDQ